MSIDWIIYIITLIISIISFIIAFPYKLNHIESTSEYLFKGNTPLLSSVGIVSSVFSVAVFFTAITSLYKLYGIIIVPIAICSGLAGIYYVKKQFDFFYLKNGVLGIEKTKENFIKFINNDNKITSILFFIIFYLIAALITEFSTLKNVIELFLPNSIWSNFALYIVLLTIFGYVYLNGFRGVLITDLLQLLIITSLLLFLIYNKSQESTIVFDKKIFQLPTIFDSTTIILGAGILAFIWFCSAPEILFKFLTIRREELNKSIRLTTILLPLVLILPFFLMISSGILPSFTGTNSSAYEVWYQYLIGSSGIIFIILIVAIIMSFYTTIDTYVITLLQTQFIVKNKSFLELFLFKNIKKSTLALVLICLIISNYIDLKWNGIIGVYAGSLSIPIFFNIYIYPSIINKQYVNSKYISSIFLQLICLIPLLFFYKYIYDIPGKSHLTYPLIPITILILELIMLFINILWKSK